MQKTFFFAGFFLLFISLSLNEQQAPVDYVNPFIDTSNYGAIHPGAVLPAGMASVVPFNIANKCCQLAANLLTRQLFNLKLPTMNKRTFLKTLSRSALATMAAPTLWSCRTETKNLEGTPAETEAPGIPGPQKNWIWIHPGTQRSEDDWKRIFAQMKEAGIDAVLPQVYAGNEALFEHPNPLVKTEKRVLEMLIPLAHEAGLEIHAWMWTMINNNPRVIEQHPDWYAVSGKGEPAHLKPAYVPYYRFMCSRREGVQEFVRGNVEALARFDELDGVHLDYVRLPDVILAKGLWSKYDIVQDREYPQYDYCYCEVCRRLFKEQSGIDPLTDLEDPAADEAWRQFRYDGITNLVNGRLVPTAKKYGKQITAAVFPNWEYVRQQWHTWNLDAFLPMLYHSFYEEDIDWIGEEVTAAYERLRSSDNPKPVYAGLFLPALSPEELPQAVASGMEAGAKGVSLFSYNSMEEAHWEQVREVK